MKGLILFENELMSPYPGRQTACW